MTAKAEVKYKPSRGADPRQKGRKNDEHKNNNNRQDHDHDQAEARAQKQATRSAANNQSTGKAESKGGVNMAYKRKTRDEYEIQGYISGYGWDVETTEETLKAAKVQAKCYRENVNYPIRIIKKRIKIENNNK